MNRPVEHGIPRIGAWTATNPARVSTATMLGRNFDELREGILVGVSMIKPIVYHNIGEKKPREEKLFASVPSKKRASASQALMDIFSYPKYMGSATKSRKK
jgi:hypothetical protein